MTAIARWGAPTLATDGLSGAARQNAQTLNRRLADLEAKLARALHLALAAVTDDGASGAAATVDFGDGAAHRLTLTANCTLTVSGAVAGQRCVLALWQDATGGRTVAWPADVDWGTAGAPTLSAASAMDLVELYHDGTAYRAFRIGAGYA